jgi:hypothetical protein
MISDQLLQSRQAATHRNAPGRCQYDCLTLLRQGRTPVQGRIGLNRLGSGHAVAFDNSAGQESWATMWEELAAMEDPRVLSARAATGTLGFLRDPCHSPRSAGAGLWLPRSERQRTQFTLLGEFSRGSPPADCGATRAAQSAEWEANCFAAFRVAILTSGGACLPPSRQWCPIRSAERDVVAAPRERYQCPTAVPGSAPVVAVRSRVGGLGGAARSTRPQHPLQ